MYSLPCTGTRFGRASSTHPTHAFLSPSHVKFLSVVAPLKRVANSNGCRHAHGHRLAAQAVQAASPVATSESSALLNWLTAEKALTDSSAATISVVDGKYRLVTTRDVREGESVFSIPDRCWLTVAVVQKSPIGKYVADLEKWLQLSLFLIHEKAQQTSPWKAYIESLPADPDTPAFWTKEQLALLQGTQLFSMLEGYLQFFEAKYAQLSESIFSQHPTVFPPDVFNYPNFQWAVCTMRSRVHTPLEAEKIALVPFADLVCHSRSGGGQWSVKAAGLFGGGQTLVWEAGQALAQGEVLTMDFGPDKLDNQLLLDYGVLDQNTDKALYQLVLSLPESDRFFDDKADIVELNKLGVSTPFTLSADEPPPFDMLAFLRLVNLQGADAFLLEALFRNEAWDHLQQAVSEENERAVCDSMIAGCRDALSSYPTSIDQDLELLRSGDLKPGSREEKAIRVCLGEKEAIDSTLRYFEDLSTRLGRLEYYATRRLKRLGLLSDSGRSTYDSFFQDGIA